MDKLKKFILFITFLCCTLSVISLGWSIVCFNEFSTLISYETHTNEDSNIYSVKIDGDYYMKNFLDKKGAWSNDDLTNFLKVSSSRGLLSFDAFEVNSVLFDKEELTVIDNNLYYGKTYASNNKSVMIVQTNPKDAYSSVSTVNLGTLGIDSKLNFFNKLATPIVAYLPTDGMNEKGLTVSLNYTTKIENEIRYYNSKDSDVTETVLLRLILDNASTVNEALEIISSYDVYLSSDYLFDITITDSNGESIKVYAEEKFYIGENLLRINSTNHNINVDSNIIEAKNSLISYKSTTDSFFNNYTVIYNKNDKIVEYYSFGDNDPLLTVKL